MIILSNNNDGLEERIKNHFNLNLTRDFTVFELSDELGVEESYIRAGINRLIKKGKMIKTPHLRSKNGSSRGYCVYQLKFFSKDIYRETLESLYGFMGDKMAFRDVKTLTIEDRALLVKIKKVIAGAEE